MHNAFNAIIRDKSFVLDFSLFLNSSDLPFYWSSLTACLSFSSSLFSFLSPSLSPFWPSWTKMLTVVRDSTNADLPSLPCNNSADNILLPMRFYHIHYTTDEPAICLNCYGERCSGENKERSAFHFEQTFWKASLTSWQARKLKQIHEIHLWNTFLSIFKIKLLSYFSLQLSSIYH